MLTGKGDVEIEVGLSVETVIVSEEEGDKYPRDHNVPKAQHCKVGRVQSVLKKILHAHIV